MNTKPLLLSISFILALGVFMQSSAQADYEMCYEKDSLIISAKWVNSKFFDKESPLELRLKIENKKSLAIEFSYEIMLYMDNVLREKTKDRFYIKAGKIKTGKLNGVRFIPTTLNNEEITSKSFSWEISIGKITEYK
ncbi:MAG: hypothetical protein U9R19_01280 [Bacteroidota bacterium]|nr:hypothetical protein [Bacteroidota bacterium]